LITARDAALDGHLDRAVTHAAAANWQWSDFRGAIADHARAALTG
jgi:hypothetical protein